MKKPVIGIIGGRGKMGQYFKALFEKDGYKVLISGRKTPLTHIQLAKKADVVIVSVPIDKTEEIIKKVSPHVKKSGLLMDFTSVKVKPMKFLSKTKASYLGCHPLFGPTAQISGQLIILCPGRGKKWHKWFKDLMTANGAVVRDLSAKKHDELMAYVQTLNHFTEIAFADALRKSKIPIDKFMTYNSPVYMLELYMMGRILNQDPNLYASIQIENPLNNGAIRNFIESCEDLEKTIEERDFINNQKFFKRNSKYLGSFCTVAMQESNRLLHHLRAKGTRIEDLDRKTKADIAVLGPKSTYSDMALQKYKKQADVFYASSIPEVFDMVSSGKVKEGLVPLENTSGGSVAETLDELYSSKVSIVKRIAQPIHLALVGTEKLALGKVKTIYSHAQPFLQSRKFLKKHCKSASLIPVASTATALERVNAERSADTIAIASKHAAKVNNLTVIKDLIEDDKTNTTYFAVIKKSSKFKPPKGGSRTAIAFHFKKDSPGSLHLILQLFADSKINLSKIESRPNTKVKGEYVFYVDFEGNLSNSKIRKALSLIKSKVAKLKVLGSY